MANQPSGFKPTDSLSVAKAIEHDLRLLATGLTEAQFHAPARDGGWSIAQCIEHLALTGQAYLPKWDVALRDAARQRLHGTDLFPYHWWHRLVLGALRPPYRIRTRAPHSLTPCSRRSIEDGIRYFLVMHHELARRIELSIGLDAGQARVQSPFASWIRYPLGFSFDFALTHERRHLWQAWRVRQQFTDGVDVAASLNRRML
jgi:hypothetical protein